MKKKRAQKIILWETSAKYMCGKRAQNHNTEKCARTPKSYTTPHPSPCPPPIHRYPLISTDLRVVERSALLCSLLSKKIPRPVQSAGRNISPL